MRPGPLLHLARYRAGALTAALLLWILFSSVPLAAGLATKALFDALSDGAGAGTSVWSLVAIVAFVQLGSEPLSVAWIYAHLSFEDVLELLVRRNVFHAALDRGDLSTSAGDALTRFRDDVDGAITPLNEWYRLVGEGVFTVAAVGIMAGIDARVTAVALLPTGVAIILLNRTRARLHAYTLAARAAASRVSGFLGDALSSVLALKVGGTEAHAVGELDALGHTRRRAALKAGVLNSILASASENVSFLSRGVVLLLAARSLRAGTFTVGDFALFSLYMEWVFEFPRRVGRVLASHRVSAVSTERLRALTPGITVDTLVAHSDLGLGSTTDRHRPQSSVGVDGGGFRELEVRRLSYSYPGSTRGIKDVSLGLKRGSFTVVTGRVGAGKSTLLRVLLGLLRAEDGEILWNGELVDGLRPPRVAYVAQAPTLFSDSLRSNLLLGLRESDVDLHGAASRAMLDRDVAALDEGLDTIVGVRGVRLSGGQVQRAAIARALLRQPKLLVVDDVSSALDVETERSLWSGIAGERPELTVLAVSSRRQTLVRAGEIILLSDGEVTGRGSLDLLLETSAEFRDLWRDG